MLNLQSTNNELEQQLTATVRFELEYQRKYNQTIDLNEKNLSNTKQFEPIPQDKLRLCHAFGS